MTDLEEARKFFAWDWYASETTGCVIDAVGEKYAKCSLNLDTRHRNADLLPELRLPPQPVCTTQLSCVSDADRVVLSVPSQAVASLAERIAPLVKADAVLVNTADSNNIPCEKGFGFCYFCGIDRYTCA